MSPVQPPSPPLGSCAGAAVLRDQLGRPLHDLRISVTDRCNFRCTYCMPKEIFGPGHPFLGRKELLTPEEISRIARIFVQSGVRKIRITGGEPLLRPDIVEVVHTLARLNGVEDIALTTNGAALSKYAVQLQNAGLHRLSVSLDALDESIFRAMSDTKLSVTSVLSGIEAAKDAGFAPIKLNMVVKRGVNENQILPLALRFAKPGFILRFIEYMDVGNTNAWHLTEVVPGAEILRLLETHAPLEKLPPNYPGETASRYRFKGTPGEIGVITSVSAPFCQNCTRARISAHGRLHTCLFSEAGLDLREHLRDGSSDETLYAVIRSAWEQRKDRYSEIRSSLSLKPSRTEMSVLGG